MEGPVRDRFRLIYLKSAGSEKSNLNEPIFPQDSKGRMTVNSSSHVNAEPFASQTRLEQAKADLKHPAPKLRILAIQYLEKVDPSVAILLLQEALSDQDHDVRTQAILALIKIKDPQVIPSLKKCLKDSSPKVKIAALRGIFQLRETIDLNILLQLMSDESPWVRRKMATLLGWVQMEGVLPILVELSRDPDAKVRKAALSSLLALYPEESGEPLTEAITDPDPYLRNWAKRILEKMAERPITVIGKGMEPSSNKTGGLGNPNL